jgi:hypothetical protein
MMPRYQFDLTTDEATASSLVQLAMGACTAFSFRMVEDDKPQKVIEAPKKLRHYVKGKTTHGEIFELCRTSLNNTASRARMLSVFERVGWSPHSVHTAINRLISTGLFESYKDGIRMLSDKTTLEQVNAKLKSVYEAADKRKVK